MTAFGPMGQPFVVGPQGDLVPETYGRSSDGDAIVFPTNAQGDIIPPEWVYITPNGDPDLYRADSRGNPTRFWMQNPNLADHYAAWATQHRRQAVQPQMPSLGGIPLETLAALL